MAQARKLSTFAGMNLYDNVKHEIILPFFYMKSNWDASIPPFLIFTTASLLYRGARLEEYSPAIAHAFLTSFFYGYTFDLANSAEGAGLEDEINKPDRPIVSKSTDLTATMTRYYIFVGAWFLYRFFLNVQRWTLLWVFTFFCTHILHLARIGHLKDLAMSLGVTAQPMTSWDIGGSDIEVGWSWVKIIIIWTFFTVPIQDFRDVSGDRACGRRTTPIILGDIPARIYTSLGLIIFEYLYVFHWVLERRYDMSTVLISIAVLALTFGLIFRLALFRTIESDRISYRGYIALYNLLFLAACVAFRIQ